jgi:hypothetical protein
MLHIVSDGDQPNAQRRVSMLRPRIVYSNRAIGEFLYTMFLIIISAGQEIR